MHRLGLLLMLMIMRFQETYAWKGMKDNAVGKSTDREKECFDLDYDRSYDSRCNKLMIGHLLVSFFLRIVPVFAVCLYSEYLEFRKNSSFAKAGRNSDINLVELTGTVNEDDRAVLLEGGGLQSASPIYLVWIMEMR
ncbi:hypothetical protein ACS0TY_027187 [Phlomoides rotata]